MNLEQNLPGELRTVAGGLDAPPPPAVDSLVQQAERIRTRTRVTRVGGVVLAAAAVTAAVLIGQQVGRPDAAPSPTHPTTSPAPLRTGAPPLVPYIVGETLYDFGDPVPGVWWDVQTVQGSTVATRSDPPIWKPVLFRNGERTHLLDGAVGTARLSARGTKLAWLEKSGSSAFLVVYDLQSAHELGRLTVDPKRLFTEDGTQETILWLDDDGTVRYGGAAGVRAWKPGGAPTAATDVPNAVDGFPVDFTELALNPDGHWAAWRSDRHGDPNLDAGGVHDGLSFGALDNPDTRFTTALPPGTDVQTVTWESATDVLLTYYARPDATHRRFMRCSVVDDRSCEYAPTQADP